MESIATPIVEIEVLGEPMGKQRPRASSWGGHTRIYTPKKTLSYEGLFASAYWDGFKKRHNGRFKTVETVYCLVKLGETLEEDEIIDKFEPKEVV